MLMNLNKILTETETLFRNTETVFLLNTSTHQLSTVYGHTWSFMLQSHLSFLIKSSGDLSPQFLGIHGMETHCTNISRSILECS